MSYARPVVRGSGGGEPWFLRGMSWTRVLWLFGIALGFAAFGVSGALIRSGGWPYRDWRDFGLDGFAWFVRYLVDFTPILIAVTVADNLPLTGARRIAALAVALVLGAQVQWPIRCEYEPETETACDDFASNLGRSYAEMLGANTVWTIAFSMPIVLAYFYRRRDLRVAQALYAAELARAEMQRRTLESELQTMQARVEPAFLFETLGDIGELYDRAPQRGERMLDELIGYLRAALPDMRVARSTLRQEIALVRAYLGILENRSPGSLAFDVDLARGLEDAAIPPMTVLPLLAAAVGAACERHDTAVVQIAALAEGARVRIAITGRGTALRPIADSAVVASCRERLSALFGSRASLVVDDEPGRRLTAVLELPHEKT